MSFETPEPLASQELSFSERTNLAIGRLEKSPYFEKVPLRLREMLAAARNNKMQRPEASGEIVEATNKAIELEKDRDMGGLNEREVQLLARSSNPLEFAKFKGPEVEELYDIKEKVRQMRGRRLGD